MNGLQLLRGIARLLLCNPSLAFRKVYFRPSCALADGDYADCTSIQVEPTIDPDVTPYFTIEG